jgi:hypothetical protein
MHEVVAASGARRGFSLFIVHEIGSQRCEDLEKMSRGGTLKKNLKWLKN